MKAWALFGRGAPTGMQRVSEFRRLPSFGTTKPMSGSSAMIWAMSPLYSRTRSTSPERSMSWPLSSWKAFTKGFWRTSIFSISATSSGGMLLTE